MKKIIRTELLLVALLLFIRCQKELSNKYEAEIGQDQATAANDTIYFEGASFQGGWGFIDDPTKWAGAYIDYFHCPDGCKLSYISFKIPYHDGAILDSLKFFSGEYGFGVPPQNVRVRYIGNISHGAIVAFKFNNPVVLKKQPYFADSTARTVNTLIKFHGPYESWIRVIPDSIRILAPNDKPLPVKGFLLRDWPKGTPTVKRVVLME